MIPGSDLYTYVVEPYSANASSLLITYGFADENRVVARCPDGLLVDTVATAEGDQTEDDCYSLLVEGMADAFYYIDQNGHLMDAVLGDGYNDLFLAVLTNRVASQAVSRGFDVYTRNLAARSTERVVAAVGAGRAVYLTVATVRDFAARSCTADRLGPQDLGLHASVASQQAQEPVNPAVPPAEDTTYEPSGVEDISLTMSQEEQCLDLEIVFHEWFMNEIEEPEARRRMGKDAEAFDWAMAELGEPTGAAEDEIYGLTGVRKYCASELR